MGALELLADVMAGPEDAPSAGLVDRLGGAVQRGASFGMLTGAVGDAMDVVGGFTGTDPLTGDRMQPWQRGLALAGLIGFGAIAAQQIRGAGPGQMLRVQRANRWQATLAPNDRFAQGVHAAARWMPEGEGRFRPGGATVPVPAAPSRLSPLTAQLPDEDLLWATVGRFTNRALSVEPDPVTGYGRIVDELAQIRPGAQWDDLHRAQVEGLVHKLAQRYITEVPANQAAVAGFTGGPEQAAVSTAAYELARWQWAAENGILQGNWLKSLIGTKGKPGPWLKLLNGQTLNDFEVGELSEAMVRFSDAMSWNPHPEFVLDPFVRLSGVNLDGDPTLSLGVLEFEAMGLDRMTAKEADRRLSLLMQTHPAALVEPMADNIDRFWKNNVTEADVRKFRHWYPAARREIETLSSARGLDAAQLTAAASILSAAEEWEQNVAKAADILAEINNTRPGAGALASIEAAVKAKGWKASRDDIVRVILMTGAEDPMEFFVLGKKSKGHSLRALGARWEQGETASALIHDRKIPQPHVALKQPSFTYGIWLSDDLELAEQAESLYRLMRGEGGAASLLEAGSNIPFSDQRRLLPVVVDRQAFKVAMGFSLVPGTWLSSQKGGFDGIAQAYRIAAARIGDIDGKPLLPEELQAITWMRWRANSKVTMPDGSPWPKGGGRIKDQLPGWKRVTSAPASWRDGLGPDYVSDDSILNMILRGRGESLPLHGVDAGTDFAAFGNELRELNRAIVAKKGQAWRQFEVVNGPDGYVVVAPEGADLPDDALRSRYPTRAKLHGRQVWAPVEPLRVQDAEVEFQRLVDDAYPLDAPGFSGHTGAQLHPQPTPDFWRRDGWFARFAALDDEGTGPEQHRRMLAELQKRGITPKASEVYPANHRGPSFAYIWKDADGVEHELWSHLKAENGLVDLTMDEYRALPFRQMDERKLGMWVEFDSPEQLRAAHELLHARVSDAEDAPTWMKAIYNEQVMDAVWYLNGDYEAPEGMRRLWEHHAVDQAGREMINLNVSGDVGRSTSVPVYVDTEFGGYIDWAGNRVHNVGGHNVHRFVEHPGGGFVFDNQAMVTPVPGMQVRPAPDPKHLFDVKIGDEGARASALFSPRVAAVRLTPGGMPEVAFGRTRAEALQVFGDTEDVVLVTRATRRTKTGGTTATSNYTAQLKLRPDSRQVPAMAATQVEELLRRAGITHVSFGSRK